MKPDEHNKNSGTSPDQEAHARPINIRNVLVAIDFSDFSKRALNYALILAEKFDAKITLIHVVQPAIVPQTLMVTTEMEVDMRIVQDRQEMLEGLRRDKINPAISSEAIVKTGEPWEKIIEEATFLRSDLIITASHGHSALEDIPLGNTAERVLRHATCSVLTVRHFAPDDDSPSDPKIRFKKILAPVDFSPASELVLAYAAQLAKLFGAEIILEHVIETELLQAPDDEMSRDAEGLLARLSQREIPSEISRQSVVGVGRPFKAISEAAAMLQVDLIILSAHSHKGLRRTLLGGTAERIVRHAPCSVWTLRG